MKLRIILFLLLFYPLFLFSDMPDEFTTYDKISMDYITPHTKWCNPYQKGKLKVLFICPTHSAREIVEFAQRFDIDFKVVMTERYMELGEKGRPWFCDSPPEKYVKELMSERLKEKYDVIVIGKIKWDIIPIESRYRILEQVSEGAGLLYICPWGEDDILKKVFEKRGKEFGEDFILNGIPKRNLPILNSLPNNYLLKTTNFGKGKIVVINYSIEEKTLRLVGGRWWSIWPYHHSLTPGGTGGLHYEFAPCFYIDTPIVYDYFLSFIGKSLLWASGKIPDISIKIDYPEKIDRELVDKNLLRLIFLNKGKYDNYEVKVRIRDIYGEEKFEKKLSVEIKKENELEISLPSLSYGIHYIDVIVFKNDKVVSFASESTEIVGLPEISYIKTSKELYKNGEKVEGIILFKMPFRKLTYLNIALFDGYKRQISSTGFFQIFPSKILKNNYVEFSLPIKNSKTQSIKIYATLKDENGIIDSKYKIIPCYPDYEYEFPFVIGGLTDALNDYINELLLNRAIEFGIEGIYNPVLHLPPYIIENNIHALTLRNLRLFPYITRLVGENVLFKGKENVISAFEERVKVVSPYLCTYTLGDDQHISFVEETGYSEEAIVSFREYLKNLHKDIETLNKNWKTNINKWEEIDKNFINEERKKQNFAPWIEHRFFMEYSFYNLHKELKDIAKKYDPSSRAGAGSLWESGGYSASLLGTNWELFTEELDYHGCYVHHSNIYKELRRCWMKKTDIASSIYCGYSLSGNQRRKKDFQEWAPWVSVLHGHKVLFLYSLSPGEGEAIFNPDLTPSSCLIWAMNEIKKLKTGIGKLILESERIDDPIGIVFSQRNVHIVNATKKAPDLIESAESITTLLQDLGYQYEMIKMDWLEKGILNNGKYKVIILPSILGLNEKQENEILKFINNGGKIITNIDFGKYDLYGFEKEKDFLSKYKIDKDSFIKIQFEKYMAQRQDLNGIEMRKKIKEFLEKIGIKPNGFLIKEKKDTNNIEIITHKFGNSYLLSFLYDINSPNPDKNMKIDIVLNEIFHIYDVMEEKYLGKTNKIENIFIKKGPAKIFALLPCKIENISLKMEKDEFKPGEEIKGDVFISGIEGSLIQKSIVNVKFFKPDGKEVQYYSQNINIEDGKGKISFITAENEEKGKWQVLVRECISGKIAKKEFYIK